MYIKNTLHSTTGIRGIFGFTLVELLVVITILAILGTIGFIQIGGFAGSARDSSRISDIANITKSLDIFFVKNSQYPSPDNAFYVTYSGGTLWSQWTIGNNVVTMFSSAGAQINKKPTDPLISGKEYTYAKLAFGNAYQLKTDWEWESVVFNLPGINTVHAQTEDSFLAYITGNYNGLITKTQANNTTYLITTPSIITSATGSLWANLDISTELANKIVVHGTKSIEWIAFTGTLVYAGTSLPSNSTELAIFASGIASAYFGTSLASQANIQPFIAAAGNTEALTSLGGEMVTGSLGGKISPTTTFSLSNSILDQNQTATITNNCSVAPTSYTSSNTSIATIVGTTITSLSPGTVTITANGGNCTDTSGKNLIVNLSTDPIWSNVVFATHMDGASGSTSFIDAKGKSITPGGSTQVSTAQSKFGGASAYFNGNTDKLSIVGSSDFNLSGDYTIEFWANRTALDNYYAFFELGTYTNGILFRARNNTVDLYVNNVAATGIGPAISANTWHHYAISRVGSTNTVYIDGVSIGSVTTSGIANSTNGGLLIGDANAGNHYSLKGYIDDFRITKGLARYTSNFTPPERTFFEQ